MLKLLPRCFTSNLSNVDALSLRFPWLPFVSSCCEFQTCDPARLLLSCFKFSLPVPSPAIMPPYVNQVLLFFNRRSCTVVSAAGPTRRKRGVHQFAMHPPMGTWNRRSTKLPNIALTRQLPHFKSVEGEARLRVLRNVYLEYGEIPE